MLSDKWMIMISDKWMYDMISGEWYVVNDKWWMICGEWYVEVFKCLK